jgi:hypothetical protein
MVVHLSSPSHLCTPISALSESLLRRTQREPLRPAPDTPLPQRTVLGRGGTEHVGGAAFRTRVVHFPRDELTMLGGRFDFGRFCIPHERRRAMAMAQVKRTGASVLRPSRRMLGIGKRVGSVSLGKQMEHVLHDFARARRHGENQDSGQIWQSACHSSALRVVDPSQCRNRLRCRRPCVEDPDCRTR